MVRVSILAWAIASGSVWAEGTLVDPRPPRVLELPFRDLDACPERFSALDQVFPVSRIREEISPTRMYLEDKTDSRFFARGELEKLPNGSTALNLSFSTKVHQEGQPILRSELRGKACFQKIFDHLNGKFESIRVSYTDLGPTDPIAMRDMLDQLNKDTGRGMSLKSAVAQTFFAKEAYKRGYRFIVADGMGGTPGNYTWVQVQLYKGEPAWWPKDYVPVDEVE